LILRIAKNYLFESAFVDVRSDNEEEDEGMMRAGRSGRNETRRRYSKRKPCRRDCNEERRESFADAVKDNRKKEL
jgi:hypothetical protein